MVMDYFLKAEHQKNKVVDGKIYNTISVVQLFYF